MCYLSNATAFTDLNDITSNSCSKLLNGIKYEPGHGGEESDG